MGPSGPSAPFDGARAPGSCRSCLAPYLRLSRPARPYKPRAEPRPGLGVLQQCHCLIHLCAVRGLGLMVLQPLHPTTCPSSTRDRVPSAAGTCRGWASLASVCVISSGPSRPASRTPVCTLALIRSRFARLPPWGAAWAPCICLPLHAFHCSPPVLHTARVTRRVQIKPGCCASADVLQGLASVLSIQGPVPKLPGPTRKAHFPVWSMASETSSSCSELRGRGGLEVKCIKLAMC